ncbi:MAG: HAMP domain-containing protein, partial [Marinilabiliales bacterium]|nr:HAMP domain-containing protein [Marinilabiliales bacterium]
NDQSATVLKENHFSVIYAREMAEQLTVMQQELTRSALAKEPPHHAMLDEAKKMFNKALSAELENLTESGEDQLAAGIAKKYAEYEQKVTQSEGITLTLEALQSTLTPYQILYQQTVLLARMNEQAIIRKAGEIKRSAENGLTTVLLFGTICFLVTLIFTFNFASYFNNRFTKLYQGIKEIGEHSYEHRLNFEGEDEFYDISMVFNEMASNLSQLQPNQRPAKEATFIAEYDHSQRDELARILEQMQGMKERALDLIAKLESKENGHGIS